MSGTWRSGGRGGAGNFVSQKDVDAAEKARRDNVSEMHLIHTRPGLLTYSLPLFTLACMHGGAKQTRCRARALSSAQSCVELSESPRHEPRLGQNRDQHMHMHMH